jgi:histone acetyltransferase
MDRVHEAMIIIKKQKDQRPVILGGCVFRPFYAQKFAEIVFLAITTSEQVKGYGTRLMNRLKDHAQKVDLNYFLTYADNNAIEYFRKQGFTKCPTMPEARWKGFIKDYNGSTMMQCKIERDVKHQTIYEDVRKQRDVSQSTIDSVTRH